MRNDKTSSLVVAYICLLLYYGFAIHLPISYSRLGGRFAKYIRAFCVRHIFKRCGKNVNVEHGARFGKGFNIEIGDNSGIGVNCFVPDGSVIGNDVMMGPNCYIHAHNHKYDRNDLPMREQGFTEWKPIVIDDDVWIGKDVSIMAGRHISKGSIIAANCVLTKDFPEYSVVGGNPSRMIKTRNK
jgi:maltose O-acetyltransferase